MHKDPNLRKRDALVIPGGLVALFTFVGLLYVLLWRGDQGTCEDAGLIGFAGDCRSAALLLGVPLVLGLALVGVGAGVFRNKSTCRKGHGSWAHFGLAVLIALVVLPAVAALAAPSLVGSDAALVYRDAAIPVPTVMGVAAAAGAVAFVPFLSLYIARTQANRCCHAKGCFEPCFCDEPAAAAALPTEAVPALQWEEAPLASPWEEAPAAAAAATEWEVMYEEAIPTGEAPAAAPVPAVAPEPAPAAAPEPAPPAAPTEEATAERAEARKLGVAKPARLAATGKARTKRVKGKPAPGPSPKVRAAKEKRARRAKKKRLAKRARAKRPAR